MNIEKVNQYSLFVSPLLCNDEQVSSQKWSPFSTPSISPYGCPPQSTYQHPFTIKSNKIDQYRDNTCFQAPIGTPSVTTRSINRYQTNQNNAQKRLPKRSEQIDYHELMQTVANQNKTNRIKMCTFCKSNGENEMIYTSHSLKSSTNKISCPILMKYTCVECGASGENTHTIKYCPVMQKKLRSQMLNKFVGSN